MNNTTTTSYDNKETIDFKTAFFYLFIFITSSMIIALLAYLLSANKLFDFIVNNEPTFSLSSNLLKYLTLIALDFVGLATYLMWFSHYVNKRPKNEIHENFIHLGILLLVFLLYPLFTFGLSLPIVGCCILGVLIGYSIYVTYRYYNSSISAGVFMTVWTLWLMYVFILNFAYCLL
ncbi:MAG: tryptophan-rich sensory protein [Clostridia bacterium]|nr:tryptophan-rich sensory protein [Clostridia bacterium]